MAANETFRIRDRRRIRFFMVDNIIIDHYGPIIGGQGFAVYGALCRMANSEEECWPSYQTIADRFNMSRRQVIREIKKLEQAGLIAIIPRFDETGQRSNLYVLLDVGVPESHPPSDSESPPPVTDSHPPGDSESPEQYTENKTHSVEENTNNNNGGGGFSVPEEITDTFTDITGDEPTEQDNQHLAELASYPQCVVRESLFALRERILDPDKETIRNKAAWLVGTARRKAAEEHERIRRIEEVSRTLTARRPYEVPEAYRDIVIA